MVKNGNLKFERFIQLMLKKMLVGEEIYLYEDPTLRHKLNYNLCQTLDFNFKHVFPIFSNIKWNKPSLKDANFFDNKRKVIWFFSQNATILLNDQSGTCMKYLQVY